MGRVLQTIAAFKQNITGGAFEALAAAAGDSLAIASFQSGSRAWLEEVYSANSANKMEVAIWSPRFHDQTRGIRLQHMFNPTESGADGEPQLIFPRTIDQPLYSSDVLSVQVNGTATNNVDVCLQVYYEDLPGAAARLATWEEISARVVDVVAIKNTLTAGAAGDYGTAKALNADDNRLKADVDYALLGITTDLPCLSIGIKGPDTGNYRIGVPGHWDSRNVADWFVQQSVWRGTPHIPVINANNAGATNCDAISSGGALAPLVSFVFAELRGRF